VKTAAAAAVRAAAARGLPLRAHLRAKELSPAAFVVETTHRRNMIHGLGELRHAFNPRARFGIAASMHQLGSAKILLVEDHSDTARVLARLLNLSGYQVHCAGTYQAAIRMCTEQEFDLLISDVGLPDGSGYDLMREVLTRRCTSKGIAVSGYGTEQDVEQSLQAGFSEHLVKPVEFDALRDAIRRVIPE
jgi:CheY-like chemotaxis protein